MPRVTNRDAFWLALVVIISLWAMSGRVGRWFSSREALPVAHGAVQNPAAEDEARRFETAPNFPEPAASKDEWLAPVTQFGSGPVRYIKLSSDSKLLLSCGSGLGTDGRIRLWEIASRRPVREFQALSSQVAGIAFAPSGDDVLSLSGETIQIWNIASGKELQKQWVGEGPMCLDVGPQAGIAAIGLASGDVMIWDYGAGIEKRRLRGHSQAVTAITFSAGGERLLTAAADQTLRFWDVASGAPIIGRSTPHIDRSAQEIKVSQAESELKAAHLAREEYFHGTFAEEEQRLLWGVSVAEQNLISAERGVQSAKRFLDKGAVTTKQVEIAEVASKAARQYLEAWQKDLERLRKYTKAKMLQQFDNEIEVAEARLREESELLKTQRMELGGDCFAKLPRTIGGTALSVSGKWIAVIQEANVVVFDAQTGDIRQKLDIPARRVSCVAFTPRGEYLLAAGNDKIVYQREVRTGQLVAQHRMRDSSISSIVITNDGRQFFTATADEKSSPSAGHSSISIWPLVESGAGDTNGGGRER